MARYAPKTPLVRIRKYTLANEYPIRVDRNVHPRPNEPRWDMHYELEMGVVISGRTRRYYKGLATTLGPGDVWLCGIWEPHGYAVLRAPCIVYVFFCRPESLMLAPQSGLLGYDWMAPFVAPAKKRPRLNAAQKKAVLRTVKKFHLNSKAGQMPLDLQGQLLAAELFLTICQNWTPPKRRFGGMQAAYSHITPAILMVLDTSGHIPLRSVAGACKMGLSRFTQTFKKLMGISFGQFALRHRLSMARQKVINTPLPLKNIANAWGFRDLSHFSKCFRAHYGCAPSSLRRLPPARTTA